MIQAHAKRNMKNRTTTKFFGSSRLSRSCQPDFVNTTELLHLFIIFIATCVKATDNGATFRDKINLNNTTTADSFNPENNSYG